MGKGDRKTTKGKRYNSSYGVMRPKTVKGAAGSASPVVKKAVAKTTTTRAATKAPAKKVVAKKTAAAKSVAAAKTAK